MIPCPNCCTDPCPIIALSTFADLDDFTQIGTVTIASGTAVLETGEGLVTVATPTNFYDPVILSFTAGTEDATATIRAMVAAVDSGNGLYGEYTISGGVGTLVVGSRDSSVNTPFIDPIEVEDTTNLGDSAPYTLCWVPGEVQTGGEFNASAFPTIANSGDGWASPENILADDVNFASYLLLSAGTTTTLIAANFQFFIPPGSSIDGIAVGIGSRYTDLGGDATVSYLRLQSGNGAVGDDRGTGQPLTEQPADGVAGSGSPTDDWNAGLTWQDVNDSSFGVQMEFSSSGGAIIEVDYVAVTVYFTTPDRQPGRLTFSRGNVTVATVDCAREFAANAPGEGKKAIVVAAAGDWDLASLDYSYHLSEAKPTCPECECTPDRLECGGCQDGDLVDEYVVDLGAGGWTNDDCTGCTALAGEFLVEHYPGLGDPEIQCYWYYFDLAAGVCDTEAHPVAATTVRFATQLNDDGSRFYAVSVHHARGPGGVVGFSFAEYRYVIEEDDADCESHFPVTLDKVYEFTSASGGADVCGGALPATVTVDVP